ncbi:enoyl-CoA hydratase [Bacillus mesophilus]|uniref:Enoyl-CoA hydratase n=1 Tax=Bacillus mesophilus TaxID=1808955 RepID=A0A6M0Q8J8_9BACI|nr:enoyl-CoA hydratase [Bacillus mesophilus]MBM7660612.1 enoyl-CoA hydratase [Bacillus mesophilus]NEY71840.1 enoyl-CoA hydratase [Bacillus mesophilus]
MEVFKIEVKDFVGVITLNSPPANALSSKVLKELSTVLDEVEHSEEVRVLLIHGEGRFFSAGADIKEFTSVPDGEAFEQLSSYGQDLFERMESFPKPIIAAIHGAALGGGLELAMGCHIRIVTENAKLGLPELQLGLIPGFAGTQRLARLVGQPKAAELLLTSDPVSGVDAVKLGLANRAVPEESLLEESLKLANKIARKSPVAVKSTLQLLNFSKSDRFYEGVKLEAKLFGEAFDSEDGKEGIAAFVEKREPVFKGR